MTVGEALDMRLFPRRSLPLILQTEAAECGLACLAMVAGYHGHELDLAAMRERFPLSIKGTTLAHLVDFADRLEMASRPVRVELDQLEALGTPCVLHWDLNHFVVLKQVAAGRITIHDPASGQKTLKLAEAGAHFTGVALELSPRASFTPRQERRPVTLRALVGGLHGIRRGLVQILLLGGFLELFTLVSPFYLQWVVDEAIGTSDRSLLVTLAIGFALLVLIQNGIGLLRSWLVALLGATVNLQWAANVFSHLLRLPISYFEKRHMGDVISRFGSIQTIQHTLTGSFVEAILDGLLAVSTLAMMLSYSARLAAVTLLAVAFYGVFRYAVYEALRQATEAEINRMARQQSLLIESIRGVQAIKLFGRESERQARWVNAAVSTANRSLTKQKLELLTRTGNTVLFGLENILIIYLGATMVLGGAFSIGMLFAFMAYKSSFTLRIIGLVDKGVDIKMLQLQGERLADIVFTPRESLEGRTAAEIEQLEPSIDVRDLSFRYADNEPLVLDRCTLTVAAGECVAIVGPSGSGKSTLFKLLLGLVPPSAGEIRIGGIPLASLRLSDYRRMIGTVMQEDQLFSGSVADNIGFFDSQRDMARIIECAKLAAIHDDIALMPMGYNTLIGDMGTALSGGQKQRMMLARALYKRPRILLLDEATSHLDATRERAVNESIRALNLTRIIIAHRQETIRMADRVIELKKATMPS